MFKVDDDLSIHATRGDIVFFTVSAEDNGLLYQFQPGDIVRMSITEKKGSEVVVMQKDFPVEEETEEVFIFLEKEDTKIGEVISKYKDYWYEVTLNPDTYPQTFIGNDEDGACLFRLYPEAGDVEETYIPEPEDFPVVDEELDMTSHRPIANHVVARTYAALIGAIERIQADLEAMKASE